MLTASRIFTPAPRLWVLATAFVPFALVGYLLASVAWWVLRRTAGVRRRRLTTSALVVSLLGVAVHAVLLVPAYVGAHATGRPDLTVLTANLRMGLADTADIARLALRGRADIVVLEEVTPTALVGLHVAGLDAALPYLAGRSFVGARGTVVFSRYPLAQVTQLAVFNGAWLMRVAAPNPFTLVAVHAAEPLAVISLWRSDEQAVVDDVAPLKGPLLLAGDFNATLDHHPIRALLGLGLQDAAQQANSGWQPTWPGAADAARGLPFGLGVMALDHVLTSRQFSAISTSTALVPGTDHRALLARLAWSDRS